MKFGYLVPEFPGQTHIMFWRELHELRAMGLAPQQVTTRRPKQACPHEWAEVASANTTVLRPVGLREVARCIGILVSSRPPARRRVAEAVVTGGGGVRGVLRRGAAVMLGARLLEVARAEEWAHVHVHSCGAAADVARMARYLGGPEYSLTLHGPLSDYGPGQRGKWSSASFGIAITDKLRGELENHVGAASLPEVVVCGMGIDPARFVRPRPYQPWQPGEGAFRVFSCARLNPVKGHADLVEAARLMREDGLDVHVRIAGEDEDGGTGYRRQLTAQIRASGMEGHVELLGAVPESRVLSELVHAHAFVLGSWEEPLGVAVMEAMAAGVPSIATRAGGVPGLIDHGRDGLLVPPRNAAALADSLTRVAMEPDLATDLATTAAASALERSQRLRSGDVLATMLRRTSTTPSG